MTQRRGGDAQLLIDGEAKTLRLTLGALAALEENLGGGDFATLQRKLAAPRVADLLIVLQALLQGGGSCLTLDALKASDIDLGDAVRAIAAAFRALAPAEYPHPEEARSAVSKDESDRRILRDASLREAPQDEESLK